VEVWRSTFLELQNPQVTGSRKSSTEPHKEPIQVLLHNFPAWVIVVVGQTELACELRERIRGNETKATARASAESINLTATTSPNLGTRTVEASPDLHVVWILLHRDPEIIHLVRVRELSHGNPDW